MIITHFGTVSKTGILNLANRKRLQADLTRLADCSVELTIKKKNRRSTPQNNFYWGVIIKEIQIELKRLGNDFTPEEVHELLKEMFNPIEIIGPGGEVIGKKGGSTTKMNKEDMSVYWDKIILWAAEFLCITIPLPSTDLQLQF